MTWIYVETSAALTWALAQPRGDEVARVVSGSIELATSELTSLEVSRVLARLPAGAAEVARAFWLALESRCLLDPVDLDLGRELGRPYPCEPVRTLDAIHLATACRLRAPRERVGFLALDERVRANAVALGFVALP